MGKRSRQIGPQGPSTAMAHRWYPLLPAEDRSSRKRFLLRFSLRDYLWAMALVCCLVAIMVQACRYSAAFSLYEKSSTNDVRFTAVDMGEQSASYLALVGRGADLDVKLTSHDGLSPDVVERARLMPGRHVMSCRVVRRGNDLVLECLCGRELYSVSLDVRNATGYSIDLSEPKSKNWTHKKQTVARVVVQQPTGNQEMSMALTYIPRDSGDDSWTKEARRQEREGWQRFLESIPSPPDYNLH